MVKGQRVWVRAYPNKKLERVVVGEEDTYILVCRPEVYEEVTGSGISLDLVMGFPKEDVLETTKPDRAGNH